MQSIWRKRGHSHSGVMRHVHLQLSQKIGGDKRKANTICKLHGTAPPGAPRAQSVATTLDAICKAVRSKFTRIPTSTTAVVSHQPAVRARTDGMQFVKHPGPRASGGLSASRSRAADTFGHAVWGTVSIGSKTYTMDTFYATLCARHEAELACSVSHASRMCHCWLF